jgi:hypothetical protein
MPLNLDNIKTLVEWLGPEGAKVGLDYGHVRTAELKAMAEASGVKIRARASRSALAEQLVMFADQRLDKSLDEMLAMSSDALLEYFERTRPSRAELLRTLGQLDFHPEGESQRSLYKYAARQISETGIFQRVARPNSQRGDPR